jgi:hypothetical protein
MDAHAVTLLSQIYYFIKISVVLKSKNVIIEIYQISNILYILDVVHLTKKMNSYFWPEFISQY